MECVGTPWLLTRRYLVSEKDHPVLQENLPPDVSIDEQRRKVASPGGTIPADALTEKFRVALQSCGQCGFRCPLNGNIPIVVDHVAGNAVVIICGNQVDTTQPFLATELVNK